MECLEDNKCSNIEYILHPQMDIEELAEPQRRSVFRQVLTKPIFLGSNGNIDLLAMKHKTFQTIFNQ